MYVRCLCCVCAVCVCCVGVLIGASSAMLRPTFRLQARSGCPVVLVDVFEGAALPPGVMERLLPFSMPAPPGTPPSSFFGKLASFCWGVPVLLSVLPTLLPFVWRHVLPAGKAAKLPLVESVAGALREGLSGGHKRQLGLVGYCYGGDAALHFNALSSSPFAATAVVHGQVTLHGNLDTILDHFSRFSPWHPQPTHTRPCDVICLRPCDVICLRPCVSR